MSAEHRDQTISQLLKKQQSVVEKKRRHLRKYSLALTGVVGYELDIVGYRSEAGSVSASASV